MINVSDQQVVRIRSALLTLHSEDQPKHRNVADSELNCCLAENAYAYVGQEREIIDGVRRLQESIEALLAERDYSNRLVLPSQRELAGYDEEGAYGAEDEVDTEIPTEQPSQQPTACTYTTNKTRSEARM